MGRHLVRGRRIAVALVLVVLGLAGTAHAAGGELAFVRGDAVWTAGADGSDQRLLLEDAKAPAWSPDGTQIAFERQFQIWVAAADGTGQRFVASGTHPTWSPDGAQLAYESSYGIYAIRADGSGERRLTPEAGDPEGPVPQFYGITPDWSPDGTKIATSGNTYPVAYRGIFLVDPAGGGFPQANPTTYGDIELTPAWAPDSTRLAVGVGGHNRAGTVVVVDGVGQITPDVLFTDPHNPTVALLVESGWPAWSPDGGQVAFQSDLADLMTHQQDVFVYDIASATTTRIVADATQPDWRTVPAAGPDCATATASPATLPRDGALHRVVIGVAGARVRIHAVRVDERRGPWWRPDVVRAKPGVVWLRGVARPGDGGRTYTIAFRARSSDGACAGAVTVRVPR